MPRTSEMFMLSAVFWHLSGSEHPQSSVQGKLAWYSCICWYCTPSGMYTWSATEWTLVVSKTTLDRELLQSQSIHNPLLAVDEAVARQLVSSKKWSWYWDWSRDFNILSAQLFNGGMSVSHFYDHSYHWNCSRQSTAQPVVALACKHERCCHLLNA